jgi:hypothetical protein
LRIEHRSIQSIKQLADPYIVTHQFTLRKRLFVKNMRSRYFFQPQKRQKNGKIFDKDQVFGF